MPHNGGIAADRRVRFVTDDAYNFLKHGRERYDLIMAEPTPPMFNFRNATLFSQEFYALARARLADHGAFAQYLPIGNLSLEETRGVLRTFASVFESCVLWWTSHDMLMISSYAPLRLDRELVSRRLARPEVRQTAQRYAFAADLLKGPDHFLAGVLLTDASFRRAAGEGPLYTNDRLGLMFSTGREVDAGNIAFIEANLAAEEELRTIAPNWPLEEVLVRRRRLVALSYAPYYPHRFEQAFQEYLRDYSLDEEADRRLLRRYRRDRDW
jgi:spermidine synthase